MSQVKTLKDKTTEG